MHAMTDYLENKLVDWLFREGTFTPPETWYIALFTGDARTDDSGGGLTEVSGGDYARVAIDGTAANWDRTNRDDSSLESSGTSGQTANRVEVVFPAPTADWGLVTHTGFFDAATGGNLLMVDEMITPRNILNGDLPPKFKVGALVPQLDTDAGA